MPHRFHSPSDWDPTPPQPPYQHPSPKSNSRTAASSQNENTAPAKHTKYNPPNHRHRPVHQTTSAPRAHPQTHRASPQPASNRPLPTPHPPSDSDSPVPDRVQPMPNTAASKIHAQKPVDFPRASQIPIPINDQTSAPPHPHTTSHNRKSCRHPQASPHHVPCEPPPYSSMGSPRYTVPLIH